MKNGSKPGCLSTIGAVVLIIIGVILIIIIGLTYYHYWSFPRITIRNNSDVKIEDIILTGSGFSQNIYKVTPWSSVKIIVIPEGESGLKIEFKAGSRQFEKDDLAYIEKSGGYFVIITINDSFGISSESGLRKFLGFIK